MNLVLITDSIVIVKRWLPLYRLSGSVATGRRLLVQPTRVDSSDSTWSSLIICFSSEVVEK